MEGRGGSGGGIWEGGRDQQVSPVLSYIPMQNTPPPASIPPFLSVIGWGWGGVRGTLAARLASQEVMTTEGKLQKSCRQRAAQVIGQFASGFFLLFHFSSHFTFHLLSPGCWSCDHRLLQRCWLVSLLPGFIPEMLLAVGPVKMVIRDNLSTQLKPG